MSTKGVADIVFCLDASGSMEPCFQGVSRNVMSLLEGMESGNRQISWDARFDFLAHRAEKEADGVSHRMETVACETGNLLQAIYGSGERQEGEQPSGGILFTSDLQLFRSRLESIEVEGDESPLTALDFCLDFPWRDAKSCHRIVIFMTDEPFETSVKPDDEAQQIPALIKKIQSLRVMLFLVTPPSPGYESLSVADRCEHVVADGQGDGLSGVDFREVLDYIGKSISASTTQGSAAPVQPGLFGQNDWGVTKGGRMEGE
jgi:hypothetical protein